MQTAFQLLCICLYLGLDIYLCLCWLSVDAKLYLCRSDNKPGDGNVSTTQQKAPEVCFVSSVQRGSPLGLHSFIIIIINNNNNNNNNNNKIKKIIIISAPDVVFVFNTSVLLVGQHKGHLAWKTFASKSLRIAVNVSGWVRIAHSTLCSVYSVGNPTCLLQKEGIEEFQHFP